MQERLLIVRPGVGDFLERLSLAFDFSFCTMGSRRYAEQIVERFRALFPRVQWASCCETVRRRTPKYVLRAPSEANSVAYSLCLVVFRTL